MVRLKVKVNTVSIHLRNIISIPYGSIKSITVTYTVRWFEISIPYGSIKRSSSWRHCRTLQISIPYGSIKRVLRFGSPGGYTLFQFLMVRLKELASQLQVTDFLISIPYGSIKRIVG